MQKETTIERPLLTGCRCAAVSNGEKIYKWDSEWLPFGGNQIILINYDSTQRYTNAVTLFIRLVINTIYCYNDIKSIDDHTESGFHCFIETKFCTQG